MAEISKTNKRKESRKRLNETMSDNDENDESLYNPSPPINSTPLQPPTKKSKKEGGISRFRWTTEMVETLIDCLNDEKSKFEFKGLDFEADLVKLYSDIRKKMAEIYKDGEFGVMDVEEIREGLGTKELALEKIRVEEEKKNIKNGYDRIKTKVKEIRQNYRKAVGEGRRSGSGKIVCDNWDKLKSIWGGSPATVCIDNSVSSMTMNSEVDPFDDWDCDREEQEEEEMSGRVSNEADASNDTSSEDFSVVNNRKSILAVNVNQTPKFVDNKRKNMEKGLSASQRDQVYMKMAKDELILKQTMVDQLTAATAESNKVFEKMSASIESVGKSIEEGLKLLAGAISNNQAAAVIPPPPAYAQNYYYPQQYQLPGNQAYPNGCHPNVPYTQTFPVSTQNESTTNDQHYESL